LAVNAKVKERAMSMGQYYQQGYQYGYQAPYLTPYAPVAYQDYGLMPIQRQAYSERFQSYWLEPIDRSEMPDTPIPGFQGLGAMSSPVMLIVVGLAAFYLLKRK
jgi:hypothetical protein